MKKKKKCMTLFFLMHENQHGNQVNSGRCTLFDTLFQREVLQREEMFSNLDFDYTPSNVLRDVADGLLYINNGKKLPLILHFDEFNITNSIGNKTKKYSIGAIYYTFANMKRRSNLHQIYLVMLFHSSHLKAHSKADILSPLIRELNSLETEGVNFLHNGRNENIKCVVSMLIGDNKGSHQIAGYFTAFHGTSRICRFCHATTRNIQFHFREDDFEMRTRVQYDAEIHQLEIEGFDENALKLFGLKERCVFNQIPSFHCIERSPVDVTHDLFEKGVVGHTLEQVLHHSVQNRFLTIEALNAAINHVPYHTTDRNRPVPVKKRPGREARSAGIKSTVCQLMKSPPIPEIQLTRSCGR